MNVQDIKKLLATEMVGGPERAASFERARSFGDKSRMDFMDGQILDDKFQTLVRLKPLINEPPQAILEALEYFGPSAVQHFIQNALAGVHELKHFSSFLQACVKLGNPSMTWEKVAAYVRNKDFDRLNPQGEITKEHDETIKAALREVRLGQRTLEDVHYNGDLSYIGAILSSYDGGIIEDPTKTARTVLDYVFDYCAKNPKRTDNEELRLSGFLVWAMMDLGRYDAWHDWENLTVAEALKKATGRHVIMDWAEPIPDLERLKVRLKSFSDQELFQTPYVHAMQIYTQNFEQKLKDILAPGSGFEPDALEL